MAMTSCIFLYANPNRTGPWSGIIGTAMSNFGFEEAVKKLGYKFKRADVGDKHVNQMLKEADARRRTLWPHYLQRS